MRKIIKCVTNALALHCKITEIFFVSFIIFNTWQNKIINKNKESCGLVKVKALVWMFRGLNPIKFKARLKPGCLLEPGFLAYA